MTTQAEGHRHTPQLIPRQLCEADSFTIRPSWTRHGDEAKSSSCAWPTA